DPDGILSKMIDYVVTDIVKPCLKFKIEHGSAALGGGVKFDDLVHKILLGPTLSAPIVELGFKRAIKSISPQFLDKVYVSTIPFRHRIV
ncbi:MAG: hypothetical protein ACXU8U_07305, partial [Asticcacaulis sp.]